MTDKISCHVKQMRSEECSADQRLSSSMYALKQEYVTEDGTIG